MVPWAGGRKVIYILSGSLLGGQGREGGSEGHTAGQWKGSERGEECGKLSIP